MPENPVSIAASAFKSGRFNCAQSALAGFQKELGLSDEAIAEAKAWGGGRAEGGRCGALHAILSLLESEDDRVRMSEAFSEAAASELCREIRQAGKLKCPDCVALAAKLLASSRGQGARP